MIGSITPAGGGFGGFGGMPIQSVRGGQPSPLGSPAALGSSAVGGSPWAGGAASDIQGAVGQLLQSVGGGLENNQALRTLITLLILMAAMEQALSGLESNSTSPATSNAAPPTTSGGNGEAGLSFSAVTTYTSLVIEQSTTTISFDMTEGSGASAGSGNDAGRSMDFFA